MKSKISSKFIIIVLSFLCIILGIICIRFYIVADKAQRNADYTYDLYLQGISDEEKNMYQEWIDNLGTDEFSAYHQGYLDGKENKGINNIDIEPNIPSNGDLSVYRQGYLDGQSDGYDNGYDNGWDNGWDDGYNAGYHN